MGKKSAILFISLNPHQKKYFHQLGEFLKSKYVIHYVHYGLSDFLGALKKPKLPPAVAFSNEELADIIRFLRVKAKVRKFSGIRAWLHSQTVLESQAHYATLYFYRFICKYKIDLVCVWNGTLVPLAAAVRVARKLGRKTIFFENGYLPNTTTVDPKGVNNCNSLVGKPRSFYDAVIPNDVWLSELHKGTASIRALKTKWYHGILKKKPMVQNEDIDLPQKFIFLPFQVNDDTQVLLHSPVIKTMDELVNYAIEAVKEHNWHYDEEVWIIAKEHPSDFGRVDYSALIERYKNEKILFLRYYPTPELIEKSSGVITLNSSVGIEALVKHKPVITLGKAFYNIEGLVCHVDDPAALIQNINFINQDLDHKLADRFLYYLKYHYLAQGSWRHPDELHFHSVAAKIACLFID